MVARGLLTSALYSNKCLARAQPLHFPFKKTLKVLWGNLINPVMCLNSLDELPWIINESF